jgi:hypothetical protein
MSQDRRGFVKSVAVVLAVVMAYGAFPEHAYGATIITTSNGVSIDSLASDRVQVTYSGEMMDVRVTEGYDYTTITVDGKLTMKFEWRRNSSGEKVLDESTMKYAGKTAWRDATQVMSPPGPCEPDLGCPEAELHPNAQAQYDLLRSAFRNLHSSGFRNALIDAQDEIESAGIANCILHAKSSTSSRRF